MKFKGALAGTASVIALAASFTSASAQQAASTSQPEIETVVVTGIVASREHALDIKRQSSTLVDVVSAEDIGKLPDKNVADALQRVPGVSTFSAASGEGGFDENDRVAVRGTSPDLTLTTIDGHSVGNGDWFITDEYQTVGRSISYDLLPSEMVSSVVVHKSQEADMMEGGTAGSVDIITRKPLDFDKMFNIEASAQGVYADLPNKTTPWLNGLLAWKNDSGTFGILVQGFYEKRDLEREGQEFLGYGQITCTPLNTTLPFNATTNRCDTTKGGQPNLINADPALNNVLYPSLIGAALFKQQRERQGGDITMEWRPDKAFDFTLSSFYSKLNASDENNNFMMWGTNEIANNQNVPTSQTIINNTLVGAVFPKVNDDCQPGFSGCGANVNGLVEDSIDRPGEGASTWYVDGDAKWTPTASLQVHAKLGYTEGKGFTPNQPVWESEGVTGTSYDYNGGGPEAVSFPDINTANPADMNADWAWNARQIAVDKEFYTQADAEYELDAGILQSIKFGIRYDDHQRTTVGWDQGDCTLICSGPASTEVWGGAYYPSNFGSALNPPAGFLQDIWYPDWSKIQNLVESTYGGFNSFNYYWQQSFGIKEAVTAGYVMGNFAGDHWKGNLGVRMVDTDENVLSNEPDGTGTSTCGVPGAIPNVFGCYQAVNTKHDYIDPLPSANFEYDLSDEQVLRAAVARTMTRPDYSALGGTVSLNDTILTGTGGDPNLKPVEAWTYDADWEWYYGPASLVSASVFYMDLTTDIGYGVANETYLNAFQTQTTGHNVYSSYAVTAPINGSGTDKGIELSWEQPLWWGFGAQANYTYSDGEQSGGGPLFGDSKNLYNIVGYWEKYGASVRVAYTWRSSVLVGLDRSTAENQAAIGNLALSASYDVTDNFTLTFDALNLNNAILHYYANNETQPRAFYDNGRQFYFGVRFKY